jgi:NADH-quinone oxidoreductase subunit L/M
VEGIVFLFLLVIFSLKVFALINRENVKNSFIIASGAEILYFGVALLGSSALSAVILHLEYQFVFRILAFLMLFEFFRFKNSFKLGDLAGVGFNKWGVIFGFYIFGSLEISLITSKQLILNAITTSGMFELGYLIVAINIIQAIYLISIFETIVFKNGESIIKNVSNKLLISIFTVGGLLVFLLPQLYLILPGKFSNINAYHISFGFNYHGINGIFALLFAFIMSMVFLYSIDYIKKYKAFYYSFLGLLTLALIEIPLSCSFESFYLLFNFWYFFKKFISFIYTHC